MLADTDAGSVITAAQSGQVPLRAGTPQLLLIPVLYLIQEMTVRLGLTTRLDTERSSVKPSGSAGHSWRPSLCLLLCGSAGDRVRRCRRSWGPGWDPQVGLDRAAALALVTLCSSVAIAVSSTWGSP